jgi:hypothetical protein
MNHATGLLLEAAVLGGAAAITYGAWEIYRPAGPIMGGLLLIAGAVLYIRGRGP